MNELKEAMELLTNYLTSEKVMNITLVGHGRLGKLISTYLGRDFTLNILGKISRKRISRN